MDRGLRDRELAQPGLHICRGQVRLPGEGGRERAPHSGLGAILVRRKELGCRHPVPANRRERGGFACHQAPRPVLARPAAQHHVFDPSRGIDGNSVHVCGDPARQGRDRGHPGACMDVVPHPLQDLPGRRFVLAGHPVSLAARTGTYRTTRRNRSAGRAPRSERTHLPRPARRLRHRVWRAGENLLYSVKAPAPPALAASHERRSPDTLQPARALLSRRASVRASDTVLTLCQPQPARPRRDGHANPAFHAQDCPPQSLASARNWTEDRKVGGSTPPLATRSTAADPLPLE